MSSLVAAARSVARFGWIASYNRLFRFSRAKAGVFFYGFAVLTVLFVGRRVRPAAAEGGLEAALLLLCLQMGWFGLWNGFWRGQYQLYQGILVPLFQITPARPLAFIVGRLFEHLPSRYFNAFLWAWAYSAAVPGAGRWPAFVLLGLAGGSVGLIAHLAGMLLVSVWAAYSPQTMRTGSVFFGTVTMALTTWVVIFLARGGDVTALALQLRALRPLFYGTGLAVLGIPGALLLGALLLRPALAEDWYRRGLYRVLELGETEDARPRRSFRLPLPDGLLRAVLTREWLHRLRARVTRVQAGVWVCGTVGVWAAGSSLAGAPPGRALLYIGFLSLLAWGLAYSHWVVRVLEAEGPALALYRIAGTPAGVLIAGKLIGVFLPSAVLTALPVLVGCLAAGLSGAETGAVLGWTLWALAAGTLGGFGAAAATAGEEPPEPETAASPSRAGPAQAGAGSPWYVLARIAGMLLPMALVLWTGAGQPWLPVPLPLAPLLAAGALLPPAMLAGGYGLLTRLWAAGR